jgi:hypothetical protein
MLLAMLVAPLPLTPAPAHAANCEFVLGFKALHDMIPDIVGQCTTNEYHNAQNGDGLQQTTAWHGKGGLLVWRKADNWTAFTDGDSTWINGPQGLQNRKNTGSCFAWENCSGQKTPTPRPTQTAASAPPACTVTTDAVTADAPQPASDGSVTWRGVVRNPCPRTATLMVDVRAHAVPNGPAFMDARTMIVADVPAGEARSISTRLPAAAEAKGFSVRAAAFDVNSAGCLGPGGTQCLTSDPVVASAVSALNETEDGRKLLKASSAWGVRVVRSDLPQNVLGMYSMGRRMVAINARLDPYSAWVRGAVLAHELQHATDDAAGRLGERGEQCYRAEEAAFRTEAYVWNAMWRNYLPPSVDGMHSELNNVTLAVFREPVNLYDAITSLYKDACGG